MLGQWRREVPISTSLVLVPFSFAKVQSNQMKPRVGKLKRKISYKEKLELKPSLFIKVNVAKCEQLVGGDDRGLCDVLFDLPGSDILQKSKWGCGSPIPL